MDTTEVQTNSQETEERDTATQAEAPTDPVDEVVEAALSCAAIPDAEIVSARYDELGRIAGDAVVSLFLRENLLPRPGEEFTLDTWSHRLTFLPHCRELLETVVHCFIERGFIEARGQGVFFVVEDPGKALSRYQSFPGPPEEREIVPHYQLMKSGLEDLRSFLAGSATRGLVDFHKEADAVILRDPVIATTQKMLLAAFRAKLEAHTDRGPLRVLVIGMGLPEFGRELLEVAAGSSAVVNVHYAEQRRGLLARAREYLGERFPGTLFRRLDLEREIWIQGFQTNFYDVVVGTGLGFTARRVKRGLFHVRRLLKARGTYLMKTWIGVPDFVSLSLGLRGAVEEEPETESPLSPELVPDGPRWQMLLSRNGFNAGMVTPGGEGFRYAFQAVFVAESAPEIAGKTVPETDFSALPEGFGESGEGLASRPALAKLNNRFHYYRAVRRRRDPDVGIKNEIGAMLAFVRDQFQSPVMGNHTVIRVLPGKDYRQDDDLHFTIRPNHPEDYLKLLEALKTQEITHVLNLWAMPDKEESLFDLDSDEGPDALLRDGLVSVFFLSKALIAAHHPFPIRLVLVYEGPPIPEHDALAGFACAIHQEFPQFFFKVVNTETALPAAGIMAELAEGASFEVHYDHRGRRSIRAFSEAEPKTGELPPLRHGGKYLVTGGFGKRALAITAYLTSRLSARVVLVGNNPPGSDERTLMATMAKSGGSVWYLKGDVSRETDMRRIALLAKRKLGELNGVIHAAGVFEPASLKKKAAASFFRVLRPRILGAYYLDQVFSREHLDFMIFFSSNASVLGLPPAVDLAAAGRCLAGFAETRNRRVKDGSRFGKTLCLDWPTEGEEAASLWRVQVDDERVSADETMIRIFEESLTGDADQWVVLVGDKEDIEARLQARYRPASAYSWEKGETEPPNDDAEELRFHDQLRTAALVWIRRTISEVSAIPPEKIQEEKPFTECGLDERGIIRLAEYLGRDFPGSSHLWFYEYPKPSLLIDFLLREYRTKILDVTGFLRPWRRHLPRLSPRPEVTEKPKFRTRKTDDLAVIGYAFRFPGAEDNEHLWDALRAKKVPRGTWTPARLAAFGPKPDSEDLPFFSSYPGMRPEIPGLDCESMTADQAFCLSLIWDAFADAGLVPPLKSDIDVGLFLGLEVKGGAGGEAAQCLEVCSQRLQLRGAGLALDVSRGNGLAPLHAAQASLRSGGCDLAVVVYCRLMHQVEPGEHVGEGAGALVLKPLTRAVSDGDVIHGVLKAGGSFRDDPQQLQRMGQVLANMMRFSGFSPGAVGAFEVSLPPNQVPGGQWPTLVAGEQVKSCYLGNVPGRFTGSPVAAWWSLARTLLQLQYRRIMPAPRLPGAAETGLARAAAVTDWPLTDHIGENGGYAPPRALCAVMEQNGSGSVLAVEAYRSPSHQGEGSTCLIPISAPSDDALLRYVVALKQFFLRRRPENLESIAYTIQTGRPAFRHRLVFWADHWKDAVSRLTDFENDTPNEAIFRGTVGDEALLLGNDEEDISFLNDLLEKRKFAKPARMWVAGAGIDWSVLYQDRRIKKETLPFADVLVPVNGQVIAANPAPVNRPAAVVGTSGSLSETIRDMAATVFQMPSDRVVLGNLPGDHGWDPVTLRSFTFLLEQRLGVALSISRLAAIPNLNALVQFLEREGTALAAMDDSGTAWLNAGVESIPPTPMQRAFIEDRGLDSGSGNIYIELEESGVIYEKLSPALRRTIECHPMLRAVIDAEGRQRVLDQVPEYEIEIYDFRDHVGLAPEKFLPSIRETMLNKSFSGFVWPLFDIALAMLPDEKMRLFILVDRLIADRHSVEIMLADWKAFYEGKTLPSPRIRYFDYESTLNLMETKARLQRDRDYWHKRLQETRGGPRWMVHEGMGLKRLRLQMEPGSKTTGDLITKSETHALPIDVFLLTAFCEYLSIYARHEHFSVNLESFSRLPVHCEIKRLVGPFMNAMLFVSNGEWDLPFSRILMNNRKAYYDDLEHTGLEGPRVFDMIRRGRKGAFTPVRVVFSYFDADSEAEAFGQKRRRVYERMRTPLSELECRIIRRGDSLCFIWDVIDNPPDLFQEMFHGFMDWLRILADQKWSDLTRKEMAALLLEQREDPATWLAYLNDQTLNRLSEGW